MSKIQFIDGNITRFDENKVSKLKKKNILCWEKLLRFFEEDFFFTQNAKECSVGAGLYYFLNMITVRSKMGVIYNKSNNICSDICVCVNVMLRNLAIQARAWE